MMKTYTEFLLETSYTNDRHELENHHFLKSKGLKFAGRDKDSMNFSGVYHSHGGKNETHLYHFKQDGEHHVHVYPHYFEDSEPSHAGVGKTPTEAMNNLKPFKQYAKKYLGESVLKEFHATSAGKEVPGAESDQGAEKYVKQVDGKWALVSRHTGRPLKYFDNKPSREEADKALRAVEYFKHS